MPFIQRVVEPKYLSRTSLRDDNGDSIISDYELEAVTNNTLSNALRQLASLVLVANDIFTELTKELQKVSARTSSLKVKIGVVEGRVLDYDPKTVAVPEGDISSFALQTQHYVSPQEMSTGLFGAETRPQALKDLYEAAAKTPVHAMRQMDRWRKDGHRSSRFFLCTPVLGARRRKLRNKVDIDIETRMPASVDALRRWTSTEAIGDVTVTTDCVNRIVPNASVTAVEDVTDIGATSGDDEDLDHKLPSPEEQLQVIALKFPAEIVAVDVSGRRFDRMSIQRRSLLRPEVTYAAEEETDGGTMRRRTRSRKPRGKRRNTLAGTDQKEIRDALTSRDEPSSSAIVEPDSPLDMPVFRSKSSDLLRSKKSSPEGKKSHFNSLKQWGKNKLKIMNKSSDSKPDSDVTNRPEDIDDINIYETVTMRRWKNSDKKSKPTHERKPSYSSSEKSSSISLPMSTPITATINVAVKLRESSTQRRQRRTGTGREEQHSSSGNWSASSESGRASIGSEITTTTTHPKSTTSAATSSNSLNQHLPPGSVISRRRFINTSASSSVTSEGTLTPDIIHDPQDDGETSSVYSCDTEGYYTSFHMDSGLKTLKEEDAGLPMTPLHSTTAFSNSTSNCTVLTAENEYELFGKGSTSTTTSSAGTVCTTLMAAESNRSLIVGPIVPERKSSLSCSISRSPSSSLERDFGSDKTGTVKRSPADSNKETVTAIIHKHSDNGDVSPDSGHNTSSSPIESVSSPNGVPSGSEFEFSESSDLEGVDRIERIRIKTTINSSRIPSMCVITPSNSDDESVISVNNYDYRRKSSSDERYLVNIPDLGSKNSSRPKLNLPLQPTETDLDTLTYSIPETKTTQENFKHELAYTNADENKPKNVYPTSGYVSVESIKQSVTTKSSPPQAVFKATLLPLNNMLGKLKTNFSNLASWKEKNPSKLQTELDDGLFDSGDYVTIADVRNNNEKAHVTAEVLYANDVINKPVGPRVRETEYVCLQDLPSPTEEHEGENKSLERNRRQGARVTLDAEGKVVYMSDSLRRRKGCHTTFEPGPFVKDQAAQSPLPVHRTPKAIRPVTSQELGKSSPSLVKKSPSSRPLSPQMNKVVIRANPMTSSGVATPTADCVRMLPATIVTPSIRPMSPKLTSARGAYVNMQEDRGRSLSPANEEERGSFTSNNLHHQSMENSHVRDDGMQYQRDVFMQRGTALYSTLPSRRPPNLYEEISENKREYSPQTKTSQQMNPEIEQYGFGSLPRRQFFQDSNRDDRIFANDYQQRTTNSVPKISNVYQNEVPYNSQNFNSRSQQQVNFHSSTPNKKQFNIASKIPMGISNFFSPIKKTQQQQHLEKSYESLKISPIDPRNSGNFESSTPFKPKEINTAINLSNRLLSPKKSTMSNEELYAVIHKSKKKLNIKTEYNEADTPTDVNIVTVKNNEAKQHPETGYLGNARLRSSWSPNDDELTNSAIALSTQPGSRQSWACSDRLGVKQTSRLDFKKLLLQQNSKTPAIPTSSKKLSAVEQLKLTRDNALLKQSQPALTIADLSASPKSLSHKKFMYGPPEVQNTTPEKQRPPAKIMSPRSNWRFASPRSDVLSSTILEDCREDETSSSNERSYSPKGVNHGQFYQNSVAARNTVTDVTANNVRRQILPSEHQYSRNVVQRNMTRSQFIQTQRDAYFNFPASSNVSKENVHLQCSSPPTLETAL